MTHTPQTRQTTELEPHPVLKAIPAPARDSDAVKACAEAIRESDGHLLPIVIDEHDNILTDDSRLRWLGATRAKLAVVPVSVQPGALAPAIALNAITHRAHLTKSARAYLAVPLLKPAFEAARLWRIRGLKNGKNPNDLPLTASGGYGATTVAEYAKQMGLSDDTLARAAKVHKAFEETKAYEFEIVGGKQDGEIVTKTFRQHFEPWLLGDMSGDEHEGKRPIGLGCILKAITSIKTTKGNARVDKGQLELFTGVNEAYGKRLRYWNDFDAPTKAQAVKSIHALVAVMPEDLRDEWMAALKAARKEARA